MTRTLYIMPCLPFPPVRGAAQRTDLLHRALTMLGEAETVSMVSPHEPMPDATAVRRLTDEYQSVGIFGIRSRGEIGPWRRIRRFSPRKVDRLARALGDADAEHRADPRIFAWLNERLRTNRYDAIVGRYLPVLAATGALEQRVVPVALDVDDLPTEMCRSRLAACRSGAVERGLERRRLRRLESALSAHFSRCRTLWVANDEHLAEPGLDRALHLPNIPYFPHGLPDMIAPAAVSQTLLFVGTFSHNANLDGLERFLHRIWPSIRAQAPDAKLQLVGSGLRDDLRARYRGHSGVEPIGFAEDLGQLYANAAFTIVPLYQGGGTNIKLAESMAWGRTAVVTPFAHRGYRSLAPHGEALLVANDDEAFVHACGRLLRCPAERDRLAASGWKQVRAHLSFDRFAAAVAEGVRAAITVASDGGIPFGTSDRISRPAAR